MNSDFVNFLIGVWREKPSLIILFVAGVIVFLLVVIDTHRHRKKLKKRHRPRPHHHDR